MISNLLDLTQDRNMSKQTKEAHDKFEGTFNSCVIVIMKRAYISIYSRESTN